MLSEKPWKLVDFLLVMALLTTLLLGGIASKFLPPAGAGAPASAARQEANFIISLGLYGTVLALVHLMVRSRGASWRAAFGFSSPRQWSALLMALGVTLIAFPITQYLGSLSASVMSRVHL